ncbi:MAG: hypothetical protein JKY37_15550 [Nannocystaceae bacterium]|nr:hypothetical protein [Nannocystaceae bacterium]
MKRLLLGLCLAAACATTAQPSSAAQPSATAQSPATALPETGALASLSWLPGTYRATHGNSVVEEVWTQPAAGTMFGVGRTFQGDKLVAFEFLRIEVRDSGLVYIAHPSGRTPGTVFTVSESASSANVVVFENPEHDFPTRITYRRVDDRHIEACAENAEHSLVLAYSRAP